VYGFSVLLWLWLSKDGLLLLLLNHQVRVQCLFREENLWLTQKALAELFGVKIPAVSKHLKNIFDSGELVEKSVVSILETVASDGNMTFSKNVRTGSISPISIVKSDA
jgi:hypothetical protein